MDIWRYNLSQLVKHHIACEKSEHPLTDWQVVGLLRESCEYANVTYYAVRTARIKAGYLSSIVRKEQYVSGKLECRQVVYEPRTITTAFIPA